MPLKAVGLAASHPDRVDHPPKTTRTLIISLLVGVSSALPPSSSGSARDVTP